MSPPLPPQVEEAQRSLLAAMEARELRPPDLPSSRWSALQRWATALLEGAFDPQRPEHRTPGVP